LGFLFLFFYKPIFINKQKETPEQETQRLLGSAVEPAFHRISNFFFFFAKIECGLYFLDRFDVLMSKMIFKK